jgi:uncharacterized tellurite resistance protein B-like protein
MSDDARIRAKERLSRLLPEVLADGHIDDSERLALSKVLAEHVLTVRDVKDVLAEYLASLQVEILADGLVTEEEEERCRAIVRELALPRELVPPELLAIVEGRKLPK